MNSVFRSGIHPDANTLSAFAEQLLPTDEREAILAHMAVCSRCREVVFLAQQAETEEPVTAPALWSARKGERHTGGHGGWRWAWIPMGAFALVVGISTVLHFRHPGAEPQMAHNTAASEGLQQLAPAPPASTSQPAPAPPPRIAAREKPPAIEKPLQLSQAKDSKAEQNEPSPRKQFGLGGAPAQPVAPAVDQMAGSFHGQVSTRAQTSPIGGPMANQLQQNAMQQQNFDRQDTLQQPENRDGRYAVQQQKLVPQISGLKPADKEASTGAAPASAGESVSVNASAPELERTPTASTPPVQLSYVPMKGKSYELSSAQLKKAAKVTLPNGAQALSAASAAERIIAIDTSGALFLSEDQGGHWQPVTTQWTGRAVLVRSMQDENKAGVLGTAPAVRFELVNDKLQAWTSADGKTWTANPAPLK